MISTGLGILLLLILVLALPTDGWSQSTADRRRAAAEGFHRVASAHGLGGVLASRVGPGPTPGRERLYLSYIYLNDTVDLVAVDPDTGDYRVYDNPAPGEYGAWGMAVGPDGDIYLGTLPHAHVLRLNPRTSSYQDLGRPSATEEYIWQLAVGADSKLYGCTYPSAKLVRVDPATGKGEDLGRMDLEEQYARYIAASTDGFVYIGIGSSKAHLVAYEIATRKHRDILPPKFQVTGFTQVWTSADGKVYAQAPGQAFRLDGWNPVPVPEAGLPGAAPTDHLKDGREVYMEGSSIRVGAGAGKPAAAHPCGYPGRGLPIFRLGLGPDAMLYASSVLPIHFLKIDPDAGAAQDLGGLGGGEFYSLLAHGDRLLMAAYSGLSPLMVYDPAKPFHPGAAETSNPILVSYPGQESSWRPQAMIAGPGGKVYLGAVSAYGKLGGPLTEWDPATGQVRSFPNVIQDQSVVSLTTWKDLLVGGTTVGGGGGSHSTQTEARIFIWDPTARKVLFESVPVPGASEITDLIQVPDGPVVGIAGGRTLFVFDPAARRVIHTSTLPFGSLVYNAVGVGPDGKIWGLARDGIFTIDPVSYEARLAAHSPEPITAGFVLHGRDVYFASGSTVYRYSIPE